MNALTKSDLEDLTFLLDAIVEQLPKMKMAEKVDVCARLRGAAKALEAIDKSVKAAIKLKRDGKEGYVNGELFRAKLTLVPITRFQQTVFKEAEPKLYDKYSETNDEARILFEPR